jgi:cellulose synthase/poly-beta-1,6-N-acetylglucosamine synthase-like glycosyltransferase
METFSQNVLVSKSTSISIVIACKNEEVNIPHLIESLRNQTYKHFELVIVNDHSSDNTIQELDTARNLINNLTIINATENGKKMALYEGIKQAKGELILCTDADCIPNSRWVESIVTFFEHYSCDLTIGPVMVKSNGMIWEDLQALEFASMVASGAGGAAIGLPFLCNGANIAFKKSVWLESQSELRYEILSGDDIFLLQSLKKRGASIKFIKSKTAIVATQAINHPIDLFTQRKRWASKSTSYNDWVIITIAIIVFTISISMVSLSISALVWIGLFTQLAYLFFLKLIVDGIFILAFKDFFQIRNPFLNTIILSVIYPFYVTFTGFAALLTNNKNTWK